MVQLHQNLVTALKQIGGNYFRDSCYGPCVNFAPRVKLARVLIKILVTQKSTFTLVHVFKIDLKAERKASAKVGKEIQILRKSHPDKGSRHSYEEGECMVKGRLRLEARAMEPLGTPEKKP